MLWKPIDLFKPKFVLFAHEDFWGGEGDGWISTFFLQILEGKRKHHLELSLKKKNFYHSVQDWGKIRQESKYFQEQSYRISTQWLKKELGYPTELRKYFTCPKRNWQEIRHPGDVKDYVLTPVSKSSYDLADSCQIWRHAILWDSPEILPEVIPPFHFANPVTLL